ncbi:DUF4347 domain-containing protein [Nisaea sp.]|uniref:DUF4347 domain-containing protein n=1 Tax=Nisaea sp. TaxID=2024842 RepID=UPI003B52E364
MLPATIDGDSDSMSFSRQGRLPRAVAVLDTATPFPDLLAAGADRDILVLRTAAKDADPVAPALASAPGPVDVLHLVSHGAPGRLILGGRSLDARRLAVLGRCWRRHLAPDATILLYGCSAGQGNAGRALVAGLAEATGARVLASSTPTGSPARGGDWRFDVGSASHPRHGARHPASAFARAHETWPGLLGTVSTLNDSGGGTLRSASGDTLLNFNGLPGVPPPSVTQTITLNSGAVTLSNPADVTIRFTGGTYNILITGDDLNLGTGNNTLFIGGVTTPQTLTVNSNITGNRVLDIGYDGTDVTVVLGGTNSMVKSTGGIGNATGAVSIRVKNDDTLSIGSDAALGSGKLALASGTLKVTGATTIDNTIYLDDLSVGNGGTIDNSADVIVSSVIEGAGNLTKSGANTLTLSGNNTYTGTTTVSNGTLSVSADGNLGTGSVTLNGGNLTVTGATTIDNAVALSSNATITNSADVTLSGVVSGANNLTKDGASTLTLSGTNTYSGTTTVSNGTLSVSADGNLGTGSVTLNGGNLTVTGATTIDNAVALSSNATITNSADVTLSGVISGANNLTKDGAGSLTLSATNTYSGTTTVSSGSLSVNGAINGGGAVTVSSGATLGGSGSISGGVTVSSGGTLAPGNSPGTLSTGNLTLSSGSTGRFEINGTTAGTEYDQIDVTGSVDVTGATLATSVGFTSSTGDLFTLIANDGADAVTGTFSGLAEGATFNSGGRIYKISYAGDTGNDVTLTDVGAVPPSPAEAIVGTAEIDLLLGSSFNDTISALADDDVVRGYGGDDTIYAADGNDRVSGEAGEDQIHGGIGIDLIYGNQSSDLIYGNQGADMLFGGQDADSIYGGQDNDLIYGNKAADMLCGNLGSDTLYGGQDGDTLSGGAGDDLLFGNRGADTFVFAFADGDDTVADYDKAEGDTLQFDAGTTLTSSTTETGLALTADGTTVTLIGVSRIEDVNLLFA